MLWKVVANRLAVKSCCQSACCGWPDICTCRIGWPEHTNAHVVKTPAGLGPSAKSPLSWIWTIWRTCLHPPWFVSWNHPCVTSICVCSSEVYFFHVVHPILVIRSLNTITWTVSAHVNSLHVEETQAKSCLKTMLLTILRGVGFKAVV